MKQILEKNMNPLNITSVNKYNYRTAQKLIA